MNKHLNKLNLEVTELESQVRFAIATCFVLCRIFRSSCRLCCWCAVCWWGVSGVTDGAAGGLLRPSVQLLPHTRELRTEGEHSLNKWNLSVRFFFFAAYQYIKFTLLCPLRFTMWRLPSSWCRTAAWRNPKPDQKVFYKPTLWIYFIITRADKIHT